MSRFDLRPYQQEFLQAVRRDFREHQHLLGVAATGCHARGTPILMSDGSTKNVEDIAVGDQLMGPDSRPRQVLRLIRGSGRLWRIIPTKGEPFVINEDHILTLVRTNDGMEARQHLSGYIKDVCFRDWLGWNKTQKHLYKLFRVPVTFHGTTNQSIDPYFLGILLGDGCLKRQISVTKPDPEILKVCEAQAKLEGGSIRVQSAPGRCPTYFFRHAPKLKQKLIRKGLYGIGSAEKFIPQEYKTGRKNDRLELLAGLLDTDGHYCGKQYDYISKSKRLSNDLAFVARSLGLAAYVSECEKGCQNGFVGTYWRVSISGDLHRIPCRIPRRQASTRKQIKDVLRTGLRAEPIGEGEFFGFTLNDDGRYLLGDFTVTHNSGKTILASELMRGWPGNCLFLADAQELVRQNADKYLSYAGEFAGVEMGDSQAQPGDRVVIATTQSICRRLDKWPRDYFSLIVVDECHRNTIGAMAAQVLLHFESAKVLGVTATPFRSDRRQLGSFYEKISVEIGLPRLIREGWLSRIVIKSVPLPVDLSAVRTRGGDYDEGDLGDAIVPHLRQAARLIAEHAAGRKTVAFLPLIATSKAFVEACREVGIRAVHVEGKEREGLRAYERGEFDLVSNASLLSTGWDHPATDCVFILRPTKSLSLFQQMVGRGTRIAEGKENLLLLDPLFLTDDHTLIKPARLLAHSADEAEELSDALAGGDEVDLLDAEEEVAEERKSRLAERLLRAAKRKARTIDAIEFCLSLSAVEVADYEPELSWEGKPPSDRQLEALARAGFDTDCVTCRGHASKILDLLFTRREHGLATPKQLNWLRRLGHPQPELATFEEAQAFLDEHFSRRAG